jgi:mediator of RNA polymerase II transcription subunit 8
VAYPSTNFPGRTQENLLGALLRKKLEPDVESWVEEGRNLAAGQTGAAAGTVSPVVANNGNGNENGSAKEERDDMGDVEDTWNFARDSIGRMVGATAFRIMRDEFTREERAQGLSSVRTGLRKGTSGEKDGEWDESAMGEEESEEESDSDEDMEGATGAKKGGAAGKTKVQGAKSLDEIVRFMTIGRRPEDEPILPPGMGLRR